MVEVLPAVLLSFALTWLLTPYARTAACRLQLLDQPDGRRKLHGRTIPVAGGPVLLTALTLALTAALAASSSLRQQALDNAPHLLGLFLAALLLVAVGLLDDLGKLRGRHKLLGQLAAVAVLLVTGLRVDSLHLLHLEVHLGPLALPFTAFFLLGAINALNLLDGMDGLLTSLALLLCLALGTLALGDGNILTAALAFATAAALLAFLRYNFPPASIFLGDSGSMLVGLLVGVLALDSSLQMPAARLALATPLTLLTLPIVDTAAAIVRRKLTGRSLYCTDRGHLHHCLLRRFGEPRRVLLVVTLGTAVLVAGVLAGRWLDSEWLLLAASLTVVAALSLSRLFGHVELHMLVQRLASLAASVLRRPGADQPRQLEMRLQGTVDWRELWQRLVSGEPSLNLCRLRLDVNAPAMGEGYHARWDCGPQADDDDGEDQRWHAQIPLAVQGRTLGALEISGRRDGASLGDTLAVLARLIHEFECNACQLVAEATPPVARLPAAKPVPRPGPALQRVSL